VITLRVNLREVNNPNTNANVDALCLSHLRASNSTSSQDRTRDHL